MRNTKTAQASSPGAVFVLDHREKAGLYNLKHFFQLAGTQTAFTVFAPHFQHIEAGAEAVGYPKGEDFGGDVGQLLDLHGLAHIEQSFEVDRYNKQPLFGIGRVKVEKAAHDAGIVTG